MEGMPGKLTAQDLPVLMWPGFHGGQLEYLAVCHGFLAVGFPGSLTIHTSFTLSNLSGSKVANDP